MYQDNISFHTTLHCATYLIKILDSFAVELPLIRGRLSPETWRSRVLNPLLQRQLNGVSDQEPEMVEQAVRSTPEKVARFYLGADLLNP